MRRLRFVALTLLTASCGLQDANAPVPQPDTPIFGRIAAIRGAADEPGSFEVEIRTGLPETLRAVMQQEGRTIPELEKSLTTKVKVTPDTVCVADLHAVDLDAFRVGQEVAVVPSPGTSAMVGTKLLLATAAEFYLFSSYQVRFIPRSLETLPATLSDRSDAGRINSSGVERTPLPLAGGRVVYFAAGLLPPIMPGGSARGAVRDGMLGPGGTLAPWAVGAYRPYRAELGTRGWSRPEPVVFPGVEPDAAVRVTWVNDAETDCLVTIERPGAPHQLLASHRADTRHAWGPLTKVVEAAGDSTGDGQRFGAHDGALVWTVYDANGSDLWLRMGAAAGQPLEPRINTLGPEWAPRVGPGTTLYFCRADRQLLFAKGVVQEVRLPGAQRRPLVEAAPSQDGAYLFLVVPRYASPQFDSDVVVARRSEKGWSEPVAIDDWRP